MPESWNTMALEIRLSILGYVLRDMDLIFDYVPASTLAQQRPVLNLLKVGKSFLTTEELEKIVLENATFRYREPRQLAHLDLKMDNLCVERIRRLFISADSREILNFDLLAMPSGQYRNRLRSLEKLTVDIYPSRRTGRGERWTGHDITIHQMALLACTGDYPRNGSNAHVDMERLTESNKETLSSLVELCVMFERHDDDELSDWLKDFLMPTPEEPWERVVQFCVGLLNERGRCFQDEEFEFGSSLPFARLVRDRSIILPQRICPQLVAKVPSLASMNEVDLDKYRREDYPAWFEWPQRYRYTHWSDIDDSDLLT